MTFEQTILAEATRIREALAEENISNMRFDIEVKGRTISGELDIEFVLGESYSAETVRGGSVEAVLQEFLRRTRWRERNAALSLSAPEKPSALSDASANDIPF